MIRALRLLSTLIMLVIGLFLTGCIPLWTVVSQAEPNPLEGQTTFIVEPISYDKVKVGKKSEEEYLAKKNKEEVEEFKNSQLGMNDKFMQSLMESGKRRELEIVRTSPHGTEVEYIVKPSIYFMEPGFFAVVASMPSEVRMSVRITDKNGKLIDEIRVASKVDPKDIKTATTDGRYRLCAEKLGTLVAEYLDQRTDKKQQ